MERVLDALKSIIAKSKRLIGLRSTCYKKLTPMTEKITAMELNHIASEVMGVISILHDIAFKPW